MSESFFIRNVRVSFPHLFKPSKMGAYGAQLMLSPDEHVEELSLIKGQINTLLAENKVKLPGDKICLKDGSANVNRPEYEGYLVLSTGGRPVVVSNSGRDVITDEESCGIYPGCRVNAKVEIWYQNNAHGKRVNAKLIAIQFAGDDEPLEGNYIPPERAMEGFGAVAQSGFGTSSSFLD